MDEPPLSQASPLSLPLRMEAKKKRSRLGYIALAVGIPLTGLGIFGFARGGAEMLGIWGVGFGLGATALGIAILVKGAKTR